MWVNQSVTYVGELDPGILSFLKPLSELSASVVIYAITPQETTTLNIKTIF